MHDVIVIETAHDLDHGVGLADIGEKLISQSLTFRRSANEARDIDKLDCCGDDRFRLYDLGKWRETLVRDGNNTYIRLDRRKGIIRGERRFLGGQSIKQRRFSDVWQANNSGLKHKYGCDSRNIGDIENGYSTASSRSLRNRHILRGTAKWVSLLKTFCMLIAILFILILSIGGIAVTYLFEKDEPLLWRIAAGTIIGQCVFGTILFLLSFGLGLGTASILIAALGTLVPIAFVIKGENKRILTHDWAKARGKLEGANLQKFAAFSYYAVFLVFFVFFFDRAVMVTAEGIFTGGSNNLGDLPFHLGIIFGFTEGANFPPQNPSFAGTKFAYPFIADLGTAALVKLGADIRWAMLVQNVSWAFALLVAFERFVFRLINDQAAARLAPVLLFLSGGLGFIWFFSDYAAQSKNIFQLLMNIGKDYTISQEFRWGNSLITLFITQRSLLLGMPLTIIALSGLWKIFTTETRRHGEGTGAEKRSLLLIFSSPPFLLGVLAGMLALIHLHSLFVLFIVTAFLLLMRRSKWREFVIFGVGVCIFALPELIWSITGSATRAGEFFGFYFGWESQNGHILDPQNYVVTWQYVLSVLPDLTLNLVSAWLKNTGILIPMLLLGIYLFYEYGVHQAPDAAAKKGHHKQRKFDADVLAADGDHRIDLLLFYIPFAFLFVLANVVKLAPWEWDNIKVLIYWMVGSIPFVVFAVVWMWRQNALGKVASFLAIFTLMAAGGLDVWRTVSRQHNYRVFEPDAVKIGERLRHVTPPDSLFLNAPTYNTAVVLSGRLSLMRYPGHLDSHGIDYKERENDVKQMYRGGLAARHLFEKYGIDYVLISPEERRSLTLNEPFFASFPLVAESGGYKVYKVNNQ